MPARAARFFSILLAMLLVQLGAISAQERSVETVEDADYFGFDLRTERDVTLDQCSDACIADQACRAFTYNTRAQWCFLKSDYAQINPFEGAIAGRIVTQSSADDIGAPPELDFLSAGIRDEARQYRGEIARLSPDTSLGVVFLTSAARGQLSAGDARAAIDTFRSALALSPDGSELWTGLAEALLAASPADWREQTGLPRDASSAALNGYLTTPGQEASDAHRMIEDLGFELDQPAAI
jgi:alpha-2-macroglobulin